mmetsp:Transcript_15884/g.62060  ORF Transcript_15884/g.62060 Transcript_15884/m.62060 type:complete len:302 (+) Transcript_15884:322-1227(+)
MNCEPGVFLAAGARERRPLVMLAALGVMEGSITAALGTGIAAAATGAGAAVTAAATLALALVLLLTFFAAVAVAVGSRRRGVFVAVAVALREEEEVEELPAALWRGVRSAADWSAALALLASTERPAEGLVTAAFLAGVFDAPAVSFEREGVAEGRDIFARPELFGWSERRSRSPSYMNGLPMFPSQEGMRRMSLFSQSFTAFSRLLRSFWSFSMRPPLLASLSHTFGDASSARRAWASSLFLIRLKMGFSSACCLFSSTTSASCLFSTWSIAASPLSTAAAADAAIPRGSFMKVACSSSA